ncbi:hypothetical protein HYC85_000073 [Camellia sinensis]|uniref:Uncharacterized protein n=1 Tax=Camellia sinensis TaxID=4442 RepID=A0A7J7FS62_CAMSI|nr:hypothetical protein HYC85_000073 [Camellia sinensis]
MPWLERPKFRHFFVPPRPFFVHRSSLTTKLRHFISKKKDKKEKKNKNRVERVRERMSTRLCAKGCCRRGYCRFY